MMLQFKVPTLEVRAEQSGTVEGYGSIFNGRDSHGDVVLPGAFHQSLQKGMPLMLWAHDQSKPVGRWESGIEDDRGLLVKGRLNLKTQAGQDAFEHLRAGDLSGLSIGFTLPRDGWRMEGDTRYLSRVDLAEVSLVSLPSNAAARVTSVKALATKPSTLREFEAALHAIGYSRREAQTIATKGFHAVEAESEELSAALARIKAAVSIF